nr:hypothetical protein JVH1_8376 [Rhodococcus sp. JVH1]
MSQWLPADVSGSDHPPPGRAAGVTLGVVRLDMAGSALAFAANRLGINQVLASCTR